MCVSYVYNDGQCVVHSVVGTPRDTVEWSGDRWQMSRDDWKEEFFFFFAMSSRGPVQVSIVGPSQEDSQPLILNPLAARIRWQAPIYRS